MANIITVEVQAQGGKALDDLKKSLVSLAPAAVPVAAGFTAVAAQAGAAAVATAAFGAAVAPQAKIMSEIAESEVALANGLKPIPAATREAARSFAQLKVSFRDWSDSLADDTMPVVNKSLLTMKAILPGLTGMVEGASTQFDRLVTSLAGGVAGGAFSGMMKQFSDFSTGALKSFTDNVIHLSRVMSEGSANGPLSEFIQYAKENGPAVQETLRSVGEAVMTLMSAMAAAGPAALTIVNVFAQLVSAIPPEFLGTLLKVYTAFKLLTAAGAGVAALVGVFGGLRTAMYGVARGAIVAGGAMAALRAGFLALGTAAKASVIVGGLALIAVGVSKLASIGKEAPPDIDRLTTALGKLGSSGQVTGEAAKAFGDDLSELNEKIKAAVDPSTTDKVQQWIVSLGGLADWDSTPVKEAKEHIDSIDQSLANLVKGGKADQAGAALKLLTENLDPEAAAEFTGNLDSYKSALEDLAFEQELAAASMGVFGQAALETERSLSEQKRAADGLRNSIYALNSAQLAASGGLIGMEAAIDAATEAAKKNGATLDINTEAGRENRTALDQLAAATMKAAESAIENGASWEEANGIYERGRENLIAAATQMGLSKEAAADLAEQILQMPDADVRIAMEKEDAQNDLETFFGFLASKPNAKSIQMEALTEAGEEKLENFGLKVKRLPDGQVVVTAANGQAITAIDDVSTALNNLDGKTANTYTTHNITTKYMTVTTTGETRNRERLRPGHYASGGSIKGPGTGTSDDIPIMASDGEFVMRAAAVDKYGEKFMQLLNEGRLEVPRFAGGGSVTKKEREARQAARGELTISYFGQMAGRRNTEFANQLGNADSLSGLIDDLNKWRSTIKKTTHGAQESRLLKMLRDGGQSLLRNQKKLESVNKSLDKAKDKLDDLRDSASQLRNSVKSGILSEGNITKAANASDSHATIGSITRQMSGQVANASELDRILAELKKRGLSGDLISQIAEAGVGGGGLETARAIMGGGKQGVKQLNELQAQLKKHADSTGKTAADAMYGAGIRATEGLVKGLQKNQDLIEKHMLKLAKSMEKAIKKALGIKSPSKVMEEIGDFTAEGFALGIEKNKSIKPAWASMLAEPSSGGSRSGSVSAGSGRTNVVLEIHSGGTAQDDFLVEALRKAVRVRGGNVQLVLGR